MSDRLEWFIVCLIMIFIVSPILYAFNIIIYETNIGDVSFYAFSILAFIVAVIPMKEYEQKE